jgi:phosphoglycerol transferase MdoB-like AlkP superfamily enzyme
VHYVDGAIGQFIKDLKARGIYDDSLIAIYGDHGSFTDTESQMRLANNMTPNGLTNSQVPLILLSKDLNKTLKGSVTTPGSHLDLYPTVANLLGVKTPATIFGKDLLNTKYAVMTHRDPYTDAITNILTTKLVYRGADDGIFENGSCALASNSSVLPIADCSDLYERQAENIRASDLIVRGNLLKRLSISAAK